GKKSAPTVSAMRCSCRIAAGRRTSVLTRSTRRRSRSMSQRASLPAVVVLPAPCRPASSTTCGGCTLSAKPCCGSPSRPTSSRCRMPMKACPGVRLVDTSAPSALVLTLSMKLLTTGRATSASISAMRTSRSVSATFSSVTRPRPRSVCTVRFSRSVNLSNIRVEPAMAGGGECLRIGRRGGPAALYSPAATDYKRHVEKTPTPVLILVLLVLLFIIAFASGTEVAMLSVNRYRIRHRVNQGQRRARQLERLLEQPDRWLGANLVILALASVGATTDATLLALRTGIRAAPLIMAGLLTVVMLVFCEFAPKIFSAVHAERVALGSAYVYRALLWILGPL